MARKTVQKPYASKGRSDQGVTIPYRVDPPDLPPLPVRRRIVRQRLPGLGGLTIGRGDASVIHVQRDEWLFLFASLNDDGADLSDWDWGTFVPSPPLIEFTLIEGESDRFAIGERRDEKRTPPYIAFAEVTRPITDELGFGEPARVACRQASDENVELARRFVAKFGPLSWGSPHQCYPDNTVISSKYMRQEFDRPGTYCGIFRNVERYVNSAPWILEESLQLRCAMALSDALRAVRSGGSLDRLRDLWDWKRGESARLFDQNSTVLDAGLRWEDLVRQSAVYLMLLVDSHVGEANAAALISPESWPRRGRGRYGSSWLAPGITSPTPLINLWLAFFDDLLWLTGEHECQGCGNGFTPRRSNQTHCSPACGARVRNRRSRMRPDGAAAPADSVLLQRLGRGRR